jgi:hypothetical protein
MNITKSLSLKFNNIIHDILLIDTQIETQLINNINRIIFLSKILDDSKNIYLDITTSLNS